MEASRTALRTGMEQAQHSLKQAEQAYAAAKAAVDALQTQQATAETAGPAQPLCGQLLGLLPQGSAGGGKAGLFCL